MNDKVKLIIVIAVFAIAGLVVLFTQTDLLGGGGQPTGNTQTTTTGADAAGEGAAGATEAAEEGVTETPTSAWGRRR